MIEKPQGYVLDTWAIIAYLEGELAGAEVRRLILAAPLTGTPLLMSVINAAEVWYTFARETSAARADQSLVELQQAGISFWPADLEMARVAAKFKAAHRMSLADCFATALAESQQAALVTGDPEFKQVEHEVKIVWLQ